jgi:hypothetical protein
MNMTNTMKMTPLANSNFPDKRRSMRPRAAHRAIALLSFVAFLGALACVAHFARAQSSESTSWNVTLVLPRKLVAGQSATLAAFGVDGKLAPGVSVDLGGQRRVQTDKTGRAYFITPPAVNVFIVKANGNSAAALVDEPAPASDPQAPSAGHSEIAVAPFVSLHDAFAICGPGLRGDADADRVKINGEPSLIVAASPDCLAVLPGANAEPGPAQISVASTGTEWTTATTLVSLEFEPPNPPLMPEKRSSLVVRVRGSDQRLRIVVVNETPGVLRFLRGDAEELLTSGGPRNFASLEVQAIRSGDFSFHARLVPAPDTEAARRYLEAAEPLAGKDLQSEIKSLAKRLAHHPRDSERIQADLNQIVAQTIAGDLRTLLDAARSAL